MRKLIVNDGRRERELLLVGRIIVGRDPTCDVSDADPLLSRRHAEFTSDGTAIVARDLGSRNGIYINGVRAAEQRLRPGDVIQIGHLKVRYIEDSAPLAAAPELADDDATALIRGFDRVASPVSAAPAGSGTASRAIPASSIEKPATPIPGALSAARPTGSTPERPAPPESEDDGDKTFVVPPPTLKPALQSSSISPLLAASTPPAGGGDSTETRVLSSSGSRPSAESIHAAAPPCDDIVPSPATIVITRTPAGSASPAVSAATVEPRQIRALSIAGEAIASFLTSAWPSPGTARVVKALEADLMLVAGGCDPLAGSAGVVAPAEALVNALNTLVARLRAAATELT